ncbi:MAG: hypothetical protein JWL61_288 [Gemmatimonadetes bacterium]|nr:hypothetical protein [Gemmatimonadota bacterium]
MTVSRAGFRRRGNYALALLSESVRPMLRGVARTFSSGPSTPPVQWRRGLIIGHSHIGDVLYRTCSLDHLQAGLPDCRWDYLTTPTSAPILSNNPAISAVLPFSFGDDSARHSRESFHLLRAARYDVVLCTNAIRHAYDFALSAALGIPNRVGFGNKGYSGLLTLAIPTEYPQPLAGYFRSMVAGVVGGEATGQLRPRVFPGAADRARAMQHLQGLDLDSSLPLIGCTATTRQMVGAWPLSFFASVLSEVVAMRPVNIVLFGAASDEASLRRIADAVPSRVHVAAGALDWLGFAEALRQCDVLLATDSGPRHLANAVGTPVAFTRNLAVSRVETGAYCVNELDLAPPTVEYLSSSALSSAMGAVSARDAAERLLSLLGRRRD